MKSQEIREKFLKFFENYHHQRVRSSPVIPAADPTILFTNAGMNQFKDYFLGVQDPPYRRATTCQKCIRAGGKHNDLENVGFTPRHHTFFEMLGNFSFGDYFKKDAIAFAWELITRYYSIPKDRLRVTVFEKDDEAFDLWKAQGIRPDWIGRLGEKDNFWAMGDTGPCGPCSEIYYDRGEKVGCGRKECAPGCDCDRFLEIWNLVFMQFNRDATGKLNPLPKPSVDTGAGLERLACVLQGVWSNYDTDIFQSIFAGIQKVTGKRYGENDATDIAMRVIADHIRSSTFIIADGVSPSNEGRGYVLRRILRRAIRYGKKLGMDKPFLHDLVSYVSESFGSFYPEVRDAKIISVMIREEEERFHETLHRGMGLLDETIERLNKDKKSVIPGDVAFKLYDTFGFPFDLIEVIASEHRLTVDGDKFNELMGRQRELSAWNKGDDASLMENIAKAVLEKKWETPFTGYDHKLTTRADLLMTLSRQGIPVSDIKAGNGGYLIFKETPFYAESGGQVGDKGLATSTTGRAEILSTFKIGKCVVHRAEVTQGSVKDGDSFYLAVNPKERRLTAINHTATHMLHAALRTTLGERVKQAGSLVDPARLRFDFTFPKALGAEQLEEIEKIINEEVRSDSEVVTQEMGYDDAIKHGALAFFDEKYGDKVRVVRVGKSDKPFSVELCGGTHLTRTSEVGFFKILSESSVASGVRRIEAITSTTAIDYLQARSRVLADVESKLNSRGDVTLSKLDQMTVQNKALQKEVEDLRLRIAQGGGSKSGGGTGSLADKAIDLPGKKLKLVIEKVPDAGAKILRTLVDQVRDKLSSRTIVVLASVADGKLALCVGLTKDLVGEFDAGKLIQPLAAEVGGTGGGRADFAQAGGSNAAALDGAFAKFRQQLEK